MAVGEYGGAERSLKLAEGLVGHDVTVLMSSTGMDNKSKVINDNLRLVHINEDPRTCTSISQYAHRSFGRNLDIAMFAMSGKLVKFKAALEEYQKNADLIILDHVGAMALINDVKLTVPVLYASHNCETSLAEQMYPKLRENIKYIKAMEQKILEKSDAFTYCSHEDAEKINELFNPGKPSYYIPNGTDERSFIRSDTSRSKDIIFIGSGHPPNVVAATNLIAVARSMPDYRFNIIGKCGESLERSSLPKNMVVHGHISEDVMDDMFKNAFAFINPMNSGSGTHLKVMRALSYGLPIISSDVGLRGFTPSEITDTMIVANGTGEMINAITTLQDSKLYSKISNNTVNLSKNYVWPKIQNDFKNVVESMLQGKELKPVVVNLPVEKKKVLIYSIIRNNAKTMDRYYAQVKAIVDRHSDEYEFYLSIYENDSTDDTRHQAMSKDWSFFNGVSIISEKLNTQFFGSVKDAQRVENLAKARNKAIEAGGFLQQCDYVLMIEGDNLFKTDAVTRLLRFGEKEPDFDVVSALSIRDNGTHYDWWATRTGPVYNKGASEVPRNFRNLEYGKYYSTSNGLCLYKTEAFKKGARHGWVNLYTGEFDCEMVVLCQEFHKLGHGNIYINYQAKSHH